jgi:predicted lipid-binding transport protein (Tim44 family)
MNAPASQLEVDRPKTGAIKFTYASGSRPLEGYTIKRGVGRGGFGEVYFATSDAGKEVALKLIRRNLEVELRGVTQCLNLKHPNLIGLYDIRADEMGDQWVIMEYVSGESLEEVIERNPNGMPVEQVLWWMRGITSGVSYLHDHGIVHRDLKPGNIFSDEGVVKIGDYGLAKFISCSRRSGQTESVGTVHYMAPEIANGRYGREIDTYALGIILFEMLTGRVPFEGESVGEVLMKHLTAEPKLDELAEPYRSIVRGALAKDPDLRLKSVNEMMSLLPAGGAGPVPHVHFAAHRPDADAAAEYSPGAAARQAFAAPAATDNVNPNSLPHAQLAASSSQSTAVEEPIVKAIREALRNFMQSWDGPSKWPPLLKALVLFGLVAVCTLFAGPIFGFAIPVLICYGVYYIIWASLVRPGLQRRAAADAAAAAETSDNYVAKAVAASAPADARTAVWQPADPGKLNPPPLPAARTRRQRPNWRDRANQELAAKPFRQKLSELLGSMIMAAVFAALAACIAPVMLGASGSFNDRLPVHLWLALVGALGSWAILIPAKFAEGKLEDQVPMRITLLAAGALVGMAAWMLSDALLISVPSWREPVDAGRGLVSQEMLGLDRPHSGLNPDAIVFMTYFAFLFLVPKWWRQGEATRESRLSLWWVIVCVFWAWLLHFFWWFPQPTGMMVAGVIAIATQLASPWMPPSRRRALSDGDYVV